MRTDLLSATFLLTTLWVNRLAVGGRVEAGRGQAATTSDR